MTDDDTPLFTRMHVERWPPDEQRLDQVAREEPLEIRVEGKPVAITMRTPGDDLDLAAGFLFTEGVVDGPDDLQALSHVDLASDQQGNTVDCILAGGVEAHRAAIERATRELYATSSCGLCGKASIDKLLVQAAPIQRRLEPSPELLRRFPELLKAAQTGFAATGGLHGAALFSEEGELLIAREDIGRHNALDKVIGARLRADQLPLDDCILVMSSRAGFEIVQKSLVAGISVVAAMGAASTLAIELAEESGMTLIGFLSEHRYNRYTH
jgi:FdhD protein